MDFNAILAYCIALTLALSVFALIIAFFANNKKFVNERKLDDLIAEITAQEITLEREASNRPKEKSWSGYWYELGSGAGYEQTSPHKTGLIAITIGVVVLFLATFGYPRDVFIGIIAAFGSVAAFRIFLKRKADKRLAEIDKQLAPLLSGMRSHLSANMTPQQAILSQVGEIPAPLGDELILLKEELDLNIPLDKALENMSHRVPSRELNFLISSMRIAISQGADLDKLLHTLQGILTQRALIADKLAAAIAEAQPAIYLTVAAIPLGLIWSYMSDEANRQFWFSFMGIIALGVIGVCYVSAIVITRKQIQKVKES